MNGTGSWFLVKDPYRDGWKEGTDQGFDNGKDSGHHDKAFSEPCPGLQGLPASKAGGWAAAEAL